MCETWARVGWSGGEVCWVGGRGGRREGEGYGDRGGWIGEGAERSLPPLSVQHWEVQCD